MSCSRLVIVVSLLAAFARPAAVRAQAPELIDRTLAIVAGQVITLSDVQTVVSLGLLEGVDARDALAAGTPRLVDRLLVLREVQRYVPPEPPDTAVADRLVEIERAAGSADALKRILDAGGFTESRVRAWIRDDLRIAAYLNQRFSAAGGVTDEEVAAYYIENRGEFDKKGLTFNQAESSIRERLAAERRRDLVEDWIEDLRRRTPVVSLWKDRG